MQTIALFLIAVIVRLGCVHSFELLSHEDVNFKFSGWDRTYLYPKAYSIEYILKCTSNERDIIVVHVCLVTFYTKCRQSTTYHKFDWVEENLYFDEILIKSEFLIYNLF